MIEEEEEKNARRKKVKRKREERRVFECVQRENTTKAKQDLLERGAA